MIEVTAEMLNAYEDSAEQVAGERVRCYGAGLAAVLAIVERDYEPIHCNAAAWSLHRCTKPRGHDGGHQHRWSGVVWP